MLLQPHLLLLLLLLPLLPLLCAHLQQEEGYASRLQARGQLLQALQHEHKLARTSTQEGRHLTAADTAPHKAEVKPPHM
jgi:hypothetical protein